MNKVRINDLARELEVKSRSILDALTAVGVTEKKTHSSSIEADEAEKVRGYIQGGGSRGAASRAAAAAAANEGAPRIDLSKAAKPGDAMRAILERRQAETAAKAAPPAPRPPVVTVPPAVAAAAPRPSVMASAPAPATPRPAVTAQVQKRHVRYIAVKTTRSKESKGSASCMVWDTQSEQVVGNTVYDCKNTPQTGSTAKFDSYSAEYVGS